MTQEVGNETFLEEAIRLAAAEKKELEAAEKCNHGYSPRSYKEHKRCCLFAREYLDALYDDNPNNFVHAVEAAKEKIFPGAWKDEKKLGLTKSKFLHIGTDAILDGDIGMARVFASFANHLEQWIDLKVYRSAFMDPAKSDELFNADERSYRKSIPCSCLDQKYKEVKSIKKIGICCNINCSLPHRKVQRSAMLSCT